MDIYPGPPAAAGGYFFALNPGITSISSFCIPEKWAIFNASKSNDASKIGRYQGPCMTNLWRSILDEREEDG